VLTPHRCARKLCLYYQRSGGGTAVGPAVTRVLRGCRRGGARATAWAGRVPWCGEKRVSARGWPTRARARRRSGAEALHRGADVEAYRGGRGGAPARRRCGGSLARAWRRGGAWAEPLVAAVGVFFDKSDLFTKLIPHLTPAGN
jgi:hypothetical protein